MIEQTAEQKAAELAPTGIELRVCADIADRQRLGITKYGMTLEQNPADFKARLTHAYQESIDQSLYLKWAIEEVERMNFSYTALEDLLTERNQEVTQLRAKVQELGSQNQKLKASAPEHSPENRTTDP